MGQSQYCSAQDLRIAPTPRKWYCAMRCGADNSSMAGKKRQKVREKDITGLKYFEKLAPLLERLHDAGCERDKAGNRQLHFDQYCLLILLYLFNPIVTSLRGIQQASELAKVQKKLGCPRAALGSLSEAASVFDAELLKEIIAELGAELKPLERDARLKDIQHTMTLVDGTLIAALPKVMEASWLKSKTGSGLVKWRLHTHFEVERYVPTRIDVTPNGGGPYDERAVLERTIQSDRLYVMDRGYAKFALFNKIVQVHSSYVCRLRDNSTYEVVEKRDLTAADRAAGVLSDQIVRLCQRQGRRAARPSACAWFASRGRRTPVAASIAAGPRGRPAMASCGSPRTCSMSRRRSSA